MNCNLYIYVSSIHPWTHRKLLNRLYCLTHIDIDKINFNSISILPFEPHSRDVRAKGIFVYRISAKEENTRQFFYESIDTMRRFLNYLTLYCNLGFMEMDNYIYTDKELTKKEIFDDKNLPPISTQAIAHIYEKSDILLYMKRAFENVGNFQTSNPLVGKIDNALSLYRSSFFYLIEGVRYILQFTALESLIEQAESTFSDELIEKIIDAVRDICKKEVITPRNINKICSRVGSLKRESIKNMIKKTLKKYSITLRGKKIDVDTLYNVRSDFVHKGIQHKFIHRYSIDMEKIITNLIKQMIKTNDLEKAGT